METNPVKSHEEPEKYSVLVVGNNPATVDHLYSKILATREARLVADVAFDLRNIVRRIRKSGAVSLIVEDTLGYRNIQHLVKLIRGNSQTRNVAITLVKSDNREFPVSIEVDEFLLKDQLTVNSLIQAIRNSVRFRRYRVMYTHYLKKGKGLFGLKK